MCLRSHKKTGFVKASVGVVRLKVSVGSILPPSVCMVCSFFLAEPSRTVQLGSF